MLRSTLHNAFLHRSLVFRIRYASTSPQTSNSSRQDVPPILPHRKQKLELHPGPKNIESNTSPSLNAAPKASTKPKAPLSSWTPPPPKKEMGIKEMVQHDLKNAEELGVLAPAPPDATVFRKIIHSTWELSKFYFRGAKLIYFRQKEISAIRRRVKEGGLGLTRSEGRLIELQRQDVNKVIPFILIAILLEEVVPIIALYAPFMLPSTCILPAQRSRIEEKKTHKALASISTSRPLFLALKAKVQDGKLPLSALRATDAPTVLCSILRLPTFGADFLRVWRIRRHLRFITNDDNLLLNDNLLESLNKHDLEQALGERGFVHQGLSLKESQTRLKWWLDSVKEYPVEDGVARRLSLLLERK